MKKSYVLFGVIFAAMICLCAFAFTTDEDVPVTVTVSGVITDEHLDQSGNVIFIPDVEIFCKTDGKEDKVGDSSKDGNYSIQVPKGKESKLRFTHSAYKDESVEIKSPTEDQKDVNVVMKLKKSKSKWW